MYILQICVLIKSKKCKIHVRLSIPVDSIPYVIFHSNLNDAFEIFIAKSLVKPFIPFHYLAWKNLFECMYCVLQSLSKYSH